MTSLDETAACSRSRMKALWVAAGPVTAVLLAGGMTGILRTAYVGAVMDQLGCPDWFAVIFGDWDVLGAAAFCAISVAVKVAGRFIST